ncbi:MAG: hypothetical protein OXC79_05530 [Candidatus Poribacteria bacterium]|nr:hypothetical protein [Candidatus Poribacteria bacterium]
MKNTKVLGSIVTLLLIGLFAAILTLVLPLRENPADDVHDCIDVEATITRNANGHIVAVYLKSNGRLIFHLEEGHKPHPLDCNQQQ